MNLGIIGAGNLGTALGERLAQAGHAIIYGTGARANRGSTADAAEVGSNAEAAQFADVLVLAVPFAAIDHALGETGDLDGQVLWSCVNALKPDMTGLAVGFDTSAAEEVARRVPQACVVAAIPPFASAIGTGSLAYDEGLRPTVFMAGDDVEAKQVVEALIRDLGAMPADAGPLTVARYIEPAMMLAVAIAYAGVPRDVGLRLLERTG
jgi:8-hydroxy-5-deazaflavin:NADPH oxidoreductase